MNMDKINSLNHESNNEVNRLIPKLIGKSVNFTKEMKDRIKANLILSEFDNKAKNEFNFYLKESNRRYMTLKSGGHLDNQIKESQIKNKERANKIFSDKVFTKLNIDNDREAMKVNHGEDILAEMDNIVNQIKTTSENSDPTHLVKKSINKKVEDIKKRASLLLDPDYLLSLRAKKIIYSPEKINEANEVSKKFFFYFFYFYFDF